MFNAAPVLVNYWSALANQFYLMTVFTLLTLVLGVKVSPSIDVKSRNYVDWLKHHSRVLAFVSN